MTPNQEAGSTCRLDPANTATLNLGGQGIPATGPPGFQLPQGLVRVVIVGGAPGQTTITLIIVYPRGFPVGTQVLGTSRAKVSGTGVRGSTAINSPPSWYVMPGAVVSGNTVTFSVSDGGFGDDDQEVNGSITLPLWVVRRFLTSP